MSAERVEERAYEQLKRLHGREIAKEMGGQVAIQKALMLCRILDIQHNGLRGERQHEVDVIDRPVECVDLSGILEECEVFDK